MKNLILNTLLVFACANAGTAMAEGDPAKGEELSATCAACHGPNGNSPAPNFPKLADLGEKYLLKQLKDVKSGAREIPEMAGILDPFSEQDLEDLAAYYNAQSMQLSGAEEKQVQVNSGAKVDALELGAKIYRAGNLETSVPPCSGCHSPRAHGNAPAGYPRLSGQHAQYVVKQLRDFRAGNRVNDGESMTMRLVAKNMSDAEIEAVANFIAGQH